MEEPDPEEDEEAFEENARNLNPEPPLRDLTFLLGRFLQSVLGMQDCVSLFVPIPECKYKDDIKKVIWVKYEFGITDIGGTAVFGLVCNRIELGVLGMHDYRRVSRVYFRVDTCLLPG